jgi:hypothetical protein
MSWRITSAAEQSNACINIASLIDCARRLAEHTSSGTSWYGFFNLRPGEDLLQ